jgi:protein-disulfide isomerase
MVADFKFTEQRHNKIIVIFLGLLFLVVIFSGWQFVSGQSLLSSSVEFLASLKSGSQLQPTIDQSDPSFGPTEAPNKIVVFADFQCPYSAQFDAEINKLKALNSSQFQVVWKDFPNYQIHAQATSSALAARCAQAQGKFWEYGSQLFLNQVTLGETLYLKIAKDLKLDQEKFYRCLKSGEFTAPIEAGFKEGIRLGITGTPYLFVNDKRADGVISVEQILAGLKLK